MNNRSSKVSPTIDKRWRNYLTCIFAVLWLLDGTKAPAATFAPTEAELDAAIQQSPQSVPDVRALLHKTEYGKTYVEMGDMKLLTKQHHGVESAFGGPPWTSGNVYYVFDAGVSSANRQKWAAAAAAWSAVANVTFLEGTGIGYHIRVQNGNTNDSAVGMVGNPQIMNIRDWDFKFIIAHEIGHALGLIHEHQRTDRGGFVTIGNLQSFCQNGTPCYTANFATQPATIYGAYDFDSVMHYHKCAFSIDCPIGTSCNCTHYSIVVLPPNTALWQDAIGLTNHLSQLDGSGMAQRYGQPGGSQELLPNGGFELNFTGWQFGGTAGSYGIATQYPHSGTHYAVLCNNLDNAISNLTHDYVNVSSTATSVSFSFWLNIVTQETSVGNLYDTLIVNLIDGTGNAHRLATYSEADQGSNVNGDYSRHSFDVTTYRGQNIRLQFAASTDEFLPTIFRIDDVSLLVAYGTAPPNQIDDPTFFVTQHYSDFLNRVPDQSGLNFWVNQITSCNGNGQCIDIKRQNVSAAFFLSGEFKETGRYVIKLQRAAFGKMSIDSTRILFQQFLVDAQTVGAGYVYGQPGAEAILDQNKNAYTQSVVGSAGFVARYPTTLPASAYVDALFATASVTPTTAERQTAITAFGAGGTTGRTAALRKVTETSTLEDAEFRSAFVLMEYFGYLRRDPDQAGFAFWLNKLNQFNGNFVDSEMVKAFITAPEYRGRFD